MAAGSSSRQTRKRQKAADWTRGQLLNTLGAGPRALCLKDCGWKSRQERKSLQRTAGSQEGQESKTRIPRNSSGGTDVLSGRESDLWRDKQEGPELKRDMQKEWGVPGPCGEQSSYPWERRAECGGGKAGGRAAPFSSSCVRDVLFALGGTGSWEDAKGLLAFPHVCIYSVH